jgi:FkbM family methyltransferase
MRDVLKKIIRHWPWPLTLNERYDRQTKAVLKKVCQPDSICIDIGCYKGDILRYMMEAAPKAKHIAFEPSPAQYQSLKETFDQQATIYPYALGNENGTTSFNYVATNPTYSGLRQRQYKGEETIEKIQVEVRRLDEVIDPSMPIHIIKIDVEGGEYDVMKGATRLLDRWHPYLIFEHGLGGADKYGIAPGDVFDLLVTQHGYQICLMSSFLKKDKPVFFTRQSFEAEFWSGRNCYFLAVKRQKG